MFRFTPTYQLLAEPKAARELRAANVASLTLHLPAQRHDALAVGDLAADAWLGGSRCLDTQVAALAPKLRFVPGGEGEQAMHLDLIHAHTVWQDGPTCGLASLQVALEFRNNAQQPDVPPSPHARESTPPDHLPPQAAPCRFCFSAFSPGLLHAAVGQGYTNHGEMYDARELASLARGQFGLPATCVRGWDDADLGLLIRAGAFVVVPYDKGSNHAPALNNGATAHWAVLVGCVARTAACTPFAFLALHGRSCHVGVWEGRALAASNKNLHSAFDGHERVPGGKFRIPESLAALRDHAVVVGELTAQARHALRDKVVGVE